MKTYLVKIIFEVLPAKGLLAEFDEQIRLVRCGSSEEAVLQAQRLAAQEEQPLNGEKVHWKFAGVSDVICIDETTENGLLFSETTFHDASSYIQYLRQRHSDLLAPRQDLNLLVEF